MVYGLKITEHDVKKTVARMTKRKFDIPKSIFEKYFFNFSPLFQATAYQNDLNNSGIQFTIRFSHKGI
jgi:hypothetical protein